MNIKNLVCFTLQSHNLENYGVKWQNIYNFIQVYFCMIYLGYLKTKYIIIFEKKVLG